jgi:hypothetical protein
MTAEEARSKSDSINRKSNSEKIEEIENKIKDAVSLGKYNIFISGINDYIKTHFMNLGYEINASRDTRDIGFYFISW